MEIVQIDGFSFAYPSAQGESDTYALKDVTLSVEDGAFCVLGGPTGCGKTTLLRALKPELTPAGRHGGTVAVFGRTILEGGHAGEGLSRRESAEAIGFVMQDPGAQIVCDTVWHELAFGLENIGMAQDEMRRRIAEVAHFFGIEPLMRMSTESLSGGQKQLVNLASLLALRPRLLLLDEPTAQLDPHAARQFVYMLTRVNRELGATVIMATHAPEDVRDCATQYIELGPVGNFVSKEQLSWRLRGRWDAWKERRKAREALAVREAYFRYDRADQWVLRGIDAQLAEGSVHAFVGGNGCGKSTLLRLMAGVLKPQRGRVERVQSSQAMLPQDPKTLLVCDSVSEELDEWRSRCGYSRDDERAMIERFGLEGLEGRHPYDLSGGQMQKLALAKLLLTGAKVLFLDEPTKGLDAASCAEVIAIMRSLADEGRAIALVTHDLDLAFACADEVSMVFDGELACTEPADEFFAHNLVYRPNDESRLFGALL